MSAHEIHRLLREAIGLDVQTLGGKTIEFAIRNRVQAVGAPHTEDYLRFLRSNPGELEELIELVVVPETWFFREPASYSALVRLLQTSTESPPFRILSIPCSTGEEPYSIGMALIGAGFPASDFAIDAMDISRQALQRAANGVYSGKSFRTSDQEFQSRHFRRQGKEWILDPEICQLVRFSQSNILNFTPPAGVGNYHVIFCRNILIYFDRALQGETVVRLGSMLTPKGTLFVGPSESYTMRSHGFLPAAEIGGFAFRVAQRVPNLSPTTLELSRREKRSSGGWIQPPRTKSSVQSSMSSGITSSIPAPALPTPAFRDLLEEARLLADSGQLDEALKQCEALIQKPAVDQAALFFLLALIKDAKGEEGEAEKWYRKTLYLKPDHVDSLMHLSLLRQKMGDPKGSLLFRRRAQKAEKPNEASMP